MSDGPTILSMDRTEPGATPEALKATEVVVELLNGFTPKLALSILSNATAILLCHIRNSETEAVEETKRMRREIERCIRANYKYFKEQERAR